MVEKYTSKGKSPVFIPGTRKPEISELYDLTKYKELVGQINNCETLTADEKTFLKFAATRHIVFKYDAIANYYANSNKDVQELMENSVLVILDIDAAIEKGFCKLQQNVEKEYERQMGYSYENAPIPTKNKSNE